jgi:hypothetical protein
MRVPSILLTQICTIKPFIGDSPSGPTYSAQFEAKCRFEERRKKFVTADGKEYISSGILFMFPDQEILDLKLDSKVTIGEFTYILTEKIPQIGFSPSHIEWVVV